MTRSIFIDFSSKLKLFKSESYEIEKGDIHSIVVHVFHDKKEIAKIDLELKNLIEGEFTLDKSGLDLDNYFSYANFQLKGIIKQKISKDILSFIKDDPLKVEFKALRVSAVNKKSSSKWDKLHSLLLNEKGGWAKIKMTIQ